MSTLDVLIQTAQNNGGDSANFFVALWNSALSFSAAVPDWLGRLIVCAFALITIRILINVF